MFNDNSTALRALETRRSGKARDLAAPGPDGAQLRRIIAIASRTPDHGKLAPWRLVIVPAERRQALAEVIADAYRCETPDAPDYEVEAATRLALHAPCLVVVLYAPHTVSKIPLWEQELSAGALCMNLLHAAHAFGFVGSWLTEWPAYSDAVRDAFGKAPERIAGFVFIGTPTRELEERLRPDPDAIVSTWDGGAN